MILPHGLEVMLILGLYLIIVIIAMTLLWRMMLAQEKMTRHLSEIAEEIKKLAAKQ